MDPNLDPNRLNSFQAWLLQERGVDPSTASVYRRHVSAAYDSPEAPTGLLRNRTRAPKTRHLTLVALKAWAEFAENEQLAKTLRSLKRNLPRPVRVQPKKPLSRSEWSRLRRAIDTSELSVPVRSVLGILVVRGLRVSDVLRMERKTLQRGLTDGVARIVLKKEQLLDVTMKPIRSYVESLLELPRWALVEDAVSPRAKPTRRRDTARVVIELALRRVAQEAGLDDVYPHRLRRTVATYFYEDSGKDIAALMAYFGWSSVQTAMGYIDHDQRDRLDAIAEKMLAR